MMWASLGEIEPLAEQVAERVRVDPVGLQLDGVQLGSPSAQRQQRPVV